MPLPMMVPTTTAPAWLTPSSRSSPAGSATLALCMDRLFRPRHQHAGNISDDERHDAAERHVPSEGNWRPTPEIKIESQPARHADDRASLSPAWHKTQQKNAQHGSPAHRGNGESAGQQSGLRLSAAARRQEQLYQQLVGSVTGSGKKSSPDDSRPKSVGAKNIAREIEHLQFAGGAGRQMKRAPASGHEVQH